MTRRTWVLAGAAGLAAATGGVVVAAGAEDSAPAVADAPATTVEVEQGPLASMIALNGTLTYRARPDGAPYSAINQASGVYTALPTDGHRVGCGQVLYRVDDEPVLLLCGWIPAYRDLAIGDEGDDVRQLNRNLRIGGDEFTWETEQALEKLQDARGAEATGELDLGDAVVLPKAVRIAKVTGRLGGAARAGAEVLQATSNRLEVQVDLEPSQQGEVRRGDRARITLPGNRTVRGRVSRLGKVARTPGKDDEPAAATIPASIALADPSQAGGLESAPVRVEITTRGVERALSVPVTALVGRSGGGYAVEVVRAGGGRELVAVELGLFDTANGRVAVEGELRAGDAVVVPTP